MGIGSSRLRELIILVSRLELERLELELLELEYLDPDSYLAFDLQARSRRGT